MNAVDVVAAVGVLTRKREAVRQVSIHVTVKTCSPHLSCESARFSEHVLAKHKLVCVEQESIVLACELGIINYVPTVAQGQHENMMNQTVVGK